MLVCRLIILIVQNKVWCPMGYTWLAIFAVNIQNDAQNTHTKLNWNRNLDVKNTTMYIKIVYEFVINTCSD